MAFGKAVIGKALDLAETTLGNFRTIAAFALPLMLLIYAVENTIHLLFPTKLIAMGKADFEFMGRSLVEFIGKTILVFVALAVSGAVGLVAVELLESGLVLASVASWVTLTLLGLLTLVAMQFAFRRFAVAETID